MKRFFIAIFAIFLLAGCESNSNTSEILLRNPHGKKCVVYIDGEKFFDTNKKDAQKKLPAEWDGALLDVRYGSYELTDTLITDSVRFDFRNRYVIKVMEHQTYIYTIDK